MQNENTRSRSNNKWWWNWNWYPFPKTKVDKSECFFDFRASIRKKYWRKAFGDPPCMSPTMTWTKSKRRLTSFIWTGRKKCHTRVKKSIRYRYDLTCFKEFHNFSYYCTCLIITISLLLNALKFNLHSN